MGADDGSSSPQGSRSPPGRSCISGRASFEEERVDANGNKIERGRKKHAATFVDQVQPGANVEEVKEVVAYKSGPYGFGSEGRQPACGCLIL
mmetsp:Transcript_7413/g.16305  ORF Transcript_7413/g.16305 Transcript_7413/m.16305 type:complete len:92 (+) Transcript_7413:337-612(+)